MGYELGFIVLTKWRINLTFRADPDFLFGSLLAYRAVYYLLPLANRLIAGLTIRPGVFYIIYPIIGRTIFAAIGFRES